MPSGSGGEPCASAAPGAGREHLQTSRTREPLLAEVVGHEHGAAPLHGGGHVERVEGAAADRGRVRPAQIGCAAKASPIAFRNVARQMPFTISSRP